MVHVAFFPATILLLCATGGAAAPAAEAAAAGPAVRSLGPITLPEGLPDGFYESDGSLDPETGYSTYEYLGPLDADVPTVIETSPNALERRATVNCVGRGAGNSVGSAESQWRSRFDNFFLNAQRSVSLVVGDSRVFACNYDRVGKRIFADTFFQNMGSINAVCGNSQAGFHENNNILINYGRDHVNNGFCGLPPM
ncbi:hypothetical protein V8F33_012147 [Rhypophila sp. PSN 637]